MKKEDELLRDLTEMIKDTQKGALKWKVTAQTTEYNECQYKDKDFVMITYEMIHSTGTKRQTTNLVFLPPLGIRYFDIDILLPYSVKASNVLTYEIHTLWVLLLDMYKKDKTSVLLDISPRELTIEE